MHHSAAVNEHAYVTAFFKYLPCLKNIFGVYLNLFKNVS